MRNFPATERDEIIHEDIQSLSLNAKHDLGLTHFSNEALEAVETNLGHSKKSFIDPDDQYQDIKRYFERPRLFVKFDASTTRGKIGDWNITSGVTGNPIARFWPASALTRLSGVYAYRATMKFTLTLSATPFQQGLITIGFQYGCGNNTEVHARGLFPPLSTNVPHARLNFSDTTIAELTVPYIFPYEFFEIANSVLNGGDNFDFPAGNLAIVQQLPYITLPGALPPRLSLYVSLHDMELFGAVPIALGAIIPQSGKFIEREQKQAKPQVSSALKTVSKVSGTVGRVAGALGIPFLSTAGTTVSWLSDKLAGTAKSFGYSKPIQEGSAARTAMISTACDPNIDIPDPSVVVAPFSTNRLDLAPVDNTMVDELSLPYVLSQWNQIFVGTMASAYLDGTHLYATRCSPTNFWFRTNAGLPGGNLPLPVSSTLTTNAYAPSTLCYLAPMFRYFRGGFKFRFTFAKTKFHAGRVIASFVPSTEDFTTQSVGTSVVPVPEVANGGVQPFGASVIFDLKDDNVFEFEVPFVCTRNWLSTLGSFGGVVLSVMDPLRITGETATTIQFLVEVCAMPDFEFADFVGAGYIAAMGPTSNSATVLLQAGGEVPDEDPPLVPLPTTPDVSFNTFRLESGEVVTDVEPVHDEKVEVCQHTMGEKITSLKEIMQIPYYSTYTQANSVATNVVTSLPNWAYYPDVALATPYVNTANFFFATMPSSLIAHMYAYCSGSTVYHAYTSSADTQIFIRQNTSDGTLPNTIPSNTTSDPRFRGVCSAPRHMSCGGAVNFLHARCPSYQKTHLVPRDNFGLLGGNAVWGSTFANASPYRNSGWLLSTTGTGPSTNLTRVTVGIAAGDDARCYQYIGPPPVLLPASTSTATVTENYSAGL